MSGLVAESRAFWAMTLKEWRILRRYPADLLGPMLWAAVLPAAYLMMADGFIGRDHHAVDAFEHRSGTTHVAAFLSLGWAVYMWLAVITWGPGLSLRAERVRGSLESTLVTKASRFTILFGGTLAHLVSALGVFAVVAAMLRFVYGSDLGLRQIWLALVVIFAATPVLFAMGGLFATAALWFQDAEGLGTLLRGLLTLFCGVTYPLAVLPTWARAVGETLPPTHVIGALRRSVLTPVGFGGVVGDVLWLLLAGLIIGWLALWIYGMSLANARRTGRLGQF